MRVLALVTGIVLLVAAGALILVAIGVLFGTATDTDTRLGVALALIAAAVLAFPADLLIVFAVRQPARPLLTGTPGPAAGTETGRTPMPTWATWPLLAILSPLVIVIVVTGTVVSWLATRWSGARPQMPAAPSTRRSPAVERWHSAALQAGGPSRNPRTGHFVGAARRSPPLLKWEQFLALSLVQGGAVLAILIVVAIVTHWPSLNQLPRVVAGFVPYAAALLVGAALLVVMVASSRRRERQRRAEIAAWVRSGGVSMYSDDGLVPGWAGRLDYIHPRQRNGRLDVLLTGSYGARRCTVADYTYDVHPEQEYVEGIGVLYPVPVVLTIVVVTMRRMYPDVRFTRRDAGSRLLRAFRGPAAGGIAEETLDRLFQVSGPDASRLHGVARPALASRLVADNVSWVDIGGHELIVAWNGRLRLARIQAALDASDAIADIVEPA